ncbi:MAG: ParB/RepB/Spo0J family partition protein [Bdellovibrionales bacterium]|nr:ParB/RepB/Spo0J family partition protein [Bdellovibrionales bacterium]
MLETNKDKKKQRLGRGLGSLFGDDATGNESINTPEAASALEDTVPDFAPVTLEKTEKTVVLEPTVPAVSTPSAGPRVWSIGVDKIYPNKEQPRKDFPQEKIAELAASIKEQGILQPITVRKIEENRYEIIAGERRWRAAQAAGLHEVPVIIKEADNKKVLEWALIENIQREDLNPVEEAEAYSQLIEDHAYTHQELATQLGKERATISNSLRLLTLTKEVRDLVKEQKLSVGHAKVLLALDQSDMQRKVAQTVLDKGLSVRATEKEVANLKKAVAGELDIEAPKSVAERLVETMESDLQKSLGTKVRIDYSGGKGRITIYFYSDDDLTLISDCLKGQ